MPHNKCAMSPKRQIFRRKTKLSEKKCGLIARTPENGLQILPRFVERGKHLFSLPRIHADGIVLESEFRKHLFQTARDGSAAEDDRKPCVTLRH